MLYITIASILSFNGYTQKVQLSAANKKYDKIAYIDAIKPDESVTENGDPEESMFMKLGTSYYYNG